MSPFSLFASASNALCAGVVMSLLLNDTPSIIEKYKLDLSKLRGTGLGEVTDQVGEVRGVAVFDRGRAFGPSARDVVQLEVGHCASLEFDWRSLANAVIQGKRKIL